MVQEYWKGLGMAVLMELQSSEGSTQLYIQSSSFTWLTVDAVSWMVDSRTYKWSIHVVCTSSQYGSPGSQILTRWLKAPNMSDSACKMEAPSFFMTWPRILCRIISITFYWLQVSHKPRFERRDHIPYLLKTGMSRSHCRGACGIGDINGVIFGKYNLLHRVSY